MRLAAIISLFLLASLNIRCDSGAYDRAIDAINYDKASHEAMPTVGKNEQVLLLKSTKENRVEKSGDTLTTDVAIETVIQPSTTTVGATPEPQTYTKVQTGRQAQSLSMADARIDIVVVVPPKSDRHVTNAVRERIANDLNGVLTGSGVLAGSNWQVIVINSSYNGAQAEIVNRNHRYPLQRLKNLLIRAASEARRGSKFYNPVPLTRMGTAKRDNLRANTHAKIFLIVADRDLICATSVKSSRFTSNCITTPIMWAQNKANENFEIYGLLRPDHTLCSKLGCKPAANTVCYSGSAQSINGNEPGCYYDRDEPFTLRQVGNGFPFCGERGGLVNPCYKRDDDHKRYLGSWFSSCSLFDSSCYQTDSRGHFVPNSGQFHLFTAAATYDNSTYMISNVIARGLRAKIAQIPAIEAVPFERGLTLNGHPENKVANVSVSISKANGSKDALQFGDFALSYASSGKMTVSVPDPQTNFPEGSTMLVTVTLKNPEPQFDVPAPPGGNEYHLLDTVVKVNGSATKNFDSNNNRITLNTRPAPGQEVAIEALYVRTSYSVAEGKDHTCSKQGGQPVDCVYDSGTLIFTNHAQLIDGNTVVDSIMVTQTLANLDEINLEKGVIDDSVKLTVEGSSESCDARILAIIDNIDNKAIDIDESYDKETDTGCKILKPLQSNPNMTVTVTYDTVSNNTEYELRVPADMLLKGSWNVRVKINGEEKKQDTDYDIDKKTKILTWLELEKLEYNTRAIVGFY